MNRSQVWCCATALAVLAGGCREAGSAEPITGPAQPAAPQEQVVTQQPATPEPKASPEQHAAAEKLGMPVVVTNSIGMEFRKSWSDSLAAVQPSPVRAWHFLHDHHKKRRLDAASGLAWPSARFLGSSSDPAGYHNSNMEQHDNRPTRNDGRTLP